MLIGEIFTTVNKKTVAAEEKTTCSKLCRKVRARAELKQAQKETESVFQAEQETKYEENRVRDISGESTEEL